MVKLLNIDRTATFAISKHNLPYIATANVAGAVDEDFSASSKLEIWSSFKEAENPINSVEIDSKAHDLTWSHDNKLLVGGLESGVVQFWDGEGLINKSTSNLSLRAASNHSGPVRSLAFNHSKGNILASGSSNSEIFIWDTTKLEQDPMIPTGDSHSNKDHSKPSDEITSLSWNYLKSYIFASASSAGFAYIWDLKSKKKVLNLSYTATTTTGNIRANLSSVAWHPNQSTKLVTASDLDSLPVLLQWDLRYAKSPELVYGGPRGFNSAETADDGHSKGILSIDWLVQDSSFLLSSGKDANTFLWDTTTGQKIASYPLHSQLSTINAIGSNSSSDWVFKSRFAGSNPEIFANATFDGKVMLQTLQDTSNEETETPNEDTNGKTEAKKETSETDFWNQISEDGVSNDEVEKQEDVKPEIFIRKAPKWLSRPVSVNFAFGGKIVHVKNASDGSSVVEILSYEPSDKKSQESVSKLKTILSKDKEKTEKIVEESSQSDSFDWKLLKELNSLQGNHKKLLEKYITEGEKPVKKTEEESQSSEESAASEEDAADEDDFFANLSETPQPAKPFVPSGEFQLFTKDENEVSRDLKKLVLSGKFLEAIDLALKNEKVIEALIIALSSKNEALKQKVLGHYFEHSINKNKDSLARVLYSSSNFFPTTSGETAATSEDSINDLVSNAAVSNWKQIALGISTYVKDSAKFNKKITELGDRVYASGSRDNAILLYFVGGSLSKISEIWLKELKQTELDIVNKSGNLEENKGLSLLDVYYGLLGELITKVLIFKVSLGISGELPNTSGYNKLVSIFLDYLKNIGDTSGDLELMSSILDVLPSDNEDVKLNKARIGKGTKTSSTDSTNTTTIKNKYNNNRRFGPGPAVPISSQRLPMVGMGTTPAVKTPGSSSRSRYVVPSQGSAQTPSILNPGASPYNATSVVSSPYAPTVGNTPYTPKAAVIPTGPTFIGGGSNNYGAPNNYGPSNGYTPAFGTAPGSSSLPPPPHSSSRSSSQNPSKSKKAGNEGWNDLPDNFASVGKNKKRAAPVNVAVPITPQQVPPPPQSPMIPGPPTIKKNFASPKVVNATLPASPANKYSPPVSSIKIPTPPVSGPPSGMKSPPPVNPYAPTRGSQFNGAYTSQPPQFGAPPMSIYSNGATNGTSSPYGTPGANYGAPSASPSPYTPASNYAPPPPTFGSQAPPAGPPKSFASAPPKVAGPPMSTSAPPVATKAKHPAGDRSHIPPAYQPIFQVLSSEFEMVKPKVPEKHLKKLADTEKRLNILYDHLNNEDLLTEPTIGLLSQLAGSLQSKDFGGAVALYKEILEKHAHETTQWGSGLKRLIDLVEVTD